MKLNFLQFFALGFMLWLAIRLLLISTYWNHIKGTWFSTNKAANIIKGAYNKNILFTFVEIIFIVFMLILLFTQWWWIGLSLLGLSIISIIVLFPLIKKNEPFNIKILLIEIVESIIALYLLWQVVNP